VVADGSAYLTTGLDGKNLLMALDVNDGSVQWQVALGNDRGGKHKKGSGSNPSPVVDGERIFAYFRSGDLACVNNRGEVQWQLNLQDRFGEDTLWWDLGSSPTVTQNAVVVAVMQTGPSYVVAFDKKSGEQLWKSDRMLGAPEEAAQSYTTPLLVDVHGEETIAVMGADHLTLHRADNGREIGRLGGFNPAGEQFFRSISSPVADGNVIVCPYSRGATLTAVNMEDLASGKGEDAILWFRDDLGSDVPTPAADNGRVYIVSDGRTSRGLVSCLDIKTGETLWEVQTPRSRIGFSSSPLVAGDHLYVTSEVGTTYVIGPLSFGQPVLVAENRIADDAQYTVASPSPLGGNLLLRSRNNLYRIQGE
jgi:outer membrane protein assembly factor BamB